MIPMTIFDANCLYVLKCLALVFVAAPCVLFAGGMLICLLLWCGLRIIRALHLRLLGLPRRKARRLMERSCKNCQQRRVGCHANCERYKADCAQDAKRRAYEKQFAYLDSMPQTATALKKTLAPRRVGGQQ